MDRIQKLKLNTTFSLLNRIATIITGFILLRLILLYFGSEVNGLVSSIKQFLSIITFLDLGLGSVVQASLYRPIAKGDNEKISLVLSSAKNYFQKIAYILIVYVFVLIIFYPLVVNRTLSYPATGSLIFAMSIRTFSQYYFGIINEFLLDADQRSYVNLGSELLVVLLNLVVAVILITQGFSIQTVMISASLIFSIRPIFLAYYVNKNYNISFNMKAKEDPINQRWNGVGQHIAWTVQNSIDIVILTLFSTLEIVSIYSVHHLVTQGVKVLIQSLTNGIRSFFGDLLANEEVKLLNHYFNLIEWGIHTGVVFLFGMTAILINSFVGIYTSGVNDVNYYVPLFSLIFVISQAVYSIRTPYKTMIFSAGHFRETQLSSFIEVIINITFSLLGLYYFGLVGIAIGTLLSMIYRTIYLVIYLSRNILFRPINIFIKHINVDILTFLIMLVIGRTVTNLITINSFIIWLGVSVLLGIISLVIILLINMVFYRGIINSLIRKLHKRF